MKWITILYSFRSSNHINLYFLLKLLNSIFLNYEIIDFLNDSKWYDNLYKVTDKKVFVILSTDFKLIKKTFKRFINDNILFIFMEHQNLNGLNSLFKNNSKFKFINLFKVYEVLNDKLTNFLKYKYFIVKDSYSSKFHLTTRNTCLLESYLWYKSIYLIEKLSSRKIKKEIYDLELKYLEKTIKKFLYKLDSVRIIKQFPIFFLRHTSILSSIYYTPFIFISSKLWKNDYIFNLINFIKFVLKDVPKFNNSWRKQTKKTKKKILNSLKKIFNFLGLELFQTKLIFKKFKGKSLKWFSNFDLLILSDSLFFRKFDQKPDHILNFFNYNNLLESSGFINKQLLKQKNEVKKIINICLDLIAKKTYLAFEKKLLIIIKSNRICFNFYSQLYRIFNLCFKIEHKLNSSIIILVKNENFSVILTSLVNFKNIADLKEYNENSELFNSKIQFFIIKEILLIKSKKNCEEKILQKIGLFI
ncbi:hypothetical protein (nucleomorph) [Guillardia theta]|uniref:Uncharacterized protein n=1 Tax=Guillardia theta TaxID=55529 RepID=Q98RQ7_GUITH|nr:hypothetical protein GTHECHR1097 [Guillardia theta]AAK39890.1 hypothetical protein [Guillardia theta]